MDAVRKELWRQKTVIALYAALFCTVGFEVTLAMTANNARYCNASLANMFWNFSLFNSFSFVGSLFAPLVLKRYAEPSCVAICYFAMSCALLLLAQMNSIHSVTMLAIAAFGFAAGLSQSAINVGFVRLFAKEYSNFIYIMYAAYALGVLTPSFLFEVGPPASDCIEMFSLSNVTLSAMHRVKSVALRSKVPADYLISMSALFQLVLTYVYFNAVTQTQTTEEAAPTDEYQDIDQNHKERSYDRNVMSILIIVTVVSCVANSLFVVFPYYLSTFSISTLNITKTRLFVGGFVFGRLIAFAASLKIAPYFIMAISIIGCGMAICCLSLDPLNLVGCCLYGMFLSPLLPTFIPYLRYYLKLNVSTIHVVITGSAFGALLYPLLVAQMIHQFGSRVLIGINFFSVFTIVVLFVGLLNIQSHLEKSQASQDPVQLLVKRFFTVESALKRTKSIRPMISRLRPNTYRKFRAHRAQAEQNIENLVVEEAVNTE